MCYMSILVHACGSTMLQAVQNKFNVDKLNTQCNRLRAAEPLPPPPCDCESGAHLRPPAPKTENFSKKTVILAERKKRLYYKALLLVFPGFSSLGDGFVKCLVAWRGIVCFKGKFPE